MATEKWPRIPPEFMKYTTAGIEFTVVFAAFVLLGFWLDRRFGTRVVFTLIGAAVGFAAALYRLVRLARGFRGKDEFPPKG